MYARKRDMMESMLTNAIIALHGSIHSSCTKLTKTQLSLNPKSNKLYFCPVCVIDILPFQQICDTEFKEMLCYHFKMDVCKQIVNRLNNESNMDSFTKANCKYRNLQWYKKCLSTTKQQHKLQKYQTLNQLPPFHLQQSLFSVNHAQ